MRRLPSAILAVMLFVVTFAVFIRVLHADFVMWDDDVAIYRNPNLGGLSFDRIQWAFTDLDSTLRYVPLSLLSWIITYQCCGLNPIGYHLGNLAFHALNVSLAFYLIMSLLRHAASWTAPPAAEVKTPKKAGAGKARRGLSGRAAPPAPSEDIRNEWVLPACAAIGAMVWGLHPLRVEPVAWCTARTYDQAVCFALISILLYIRSAARTERPQHTQPAFWGSVLAFAASLLSHPVGLGLVAILPLIDVYPLGNIRLNRSGWWRRDTWSRLLWKLPFAAVVAGVLVITVAARFHSSQYFDAAVPLAQFGAVDRFMQAMYIWAYYAWRPWWPTDVSPAYTMLVSFLPWQWPFVCSALAVTGVTVALIALRRRFPAALALWTAHLVLLIPVLGLTEHPHYSADRYSLLQGLLWSIAVAGVLWRLWRPGRPRWAAKAATVAAMSIVVVLSTTTVRQTAVWHDSESLFQHVITVLHDNPLRADIYRRRAVFRMNTTPPNVDAAVQDLTAAVATDPPNRSVRVLLARILSDHGRHGEVIPLMQNGLRYHPNLMEFHYFLGMALAGAGRLNEASEQLGIVLKANPDSALAQQGMAAIQQAMQQSGAPR